MKNTYIKFLLFSLFSLFLFPTFTNAQSINYVIGGSSPFNPITSGQVYRNNIADFTINQDGWLFFNILSTPLTNSNYPTIQLKDVQLNVNAKVHISCVVNGTSGYNDSSHITYLYSVACPINANSTITSIDATMYETGHAGNVYFSQSGQFVTDNGSGITPTDYTSLLNSIEYQLLSLNNLQNITDQSVNSFKVDVTNWLSQIVTTINNNTQSIINNDNSNTDRIINAINGSNVTCSLFDKSYSAIDNKYINSNGQERDTQDGYSISDYITVNRVSVSVVDTANLQVYACFYTRDKELISCIKEDTTSMPINSNLNVPENAYYFRYTINNNRNLPSFRLCSNATNALNNSITDSNVDSSTNNFNNIVDNDNFEDNFNLNDIISLPLRFINNINQTCTPINLTLPYLNYDFTLPCFSSILISKFPGLFYVLKIVINGVVVYYIVLDIVRIIKNSKDPNNDRIEVLSL